MKKLKYILPSFIIGLLLGGLLCYGGIELLPKLEENRNVYERFTAGKPVSFEGIRSLDRTNGGRYESTMMSLFVCTTSKDTAKMDIDRIRTLSDQYDNVLLSYIADEDFRALVKADAYSQPHDPTGTSSWLASVYTGLFNEKALSPATYLLVDSHGILLFKSHSLDEVSNYLASS